MNVGGHVGTSDFTRSLVVELNERQLAFLDRARAKNPKRDVRLTLELTTRHMSSRVRPKQRNDTPFIFLEPDGNTLVEVHYFLEDHPFTISASDWVHDFWGPWQEQQFVVVDLPVPTVVTKDADVQERLTAALERLNEAKEHMQHGDWPEACDALRPVWEVLRDSVAIKKLLVDDGFTEDAATLFQESLHKQFELASKFIHVLDKKKAKTIPIINPQREDAEFVYSLAVHALQLVAKKSARLA